VPASELPAHPPDRRGTLTATSTAIVPDELQAQHHDRLRLAGEAPEQVDEARFFETLEERDRFCDMAPVSEWSSAA
jgi:hypothetical protein